MTIAMNINHLKVFSERFKPTFAVASADLLVTNDLATQFALPNKYKLVRTAARIRKQLDVSMSPIQDVNNKLFWNFKEL